MKATSVIPGLLVASVCLANVIRIPDDFTTIQAGIDDAAAGDTIVVAQGIFHESVVITDPLTLISAEFLQDETNESTSISGNNLPAIIVSSVQNGTVNIVGISIVSGGYYNFGAENNYSGLACISSDVIVNHCRIVDMAEYPQYGIVSYNSACTVTNSMFSNNFRSLRLSGGICEIILSEFLQNQSCIAIVNNTSELTIDRSEFINNYGYLIADIASSSRNIVNVMNSLFHNNNQYFSSAFTFYTTDAIFTKSSFFSNYYETNIESYASSIISSESIFYGGGLVRLNAFQNYGSSIAEISYSAIYGGQDSFMLDQNSVLNYRLGNVESDPLFSNSEFLGQLSPTSPCIDAGDPSSPLDPDGTRADIGAYYFCQGEGIALPDILRASTEPGYPEPITVSLHSSCDPVAIDSARTETGLFTLDSYPSQVAGDFQSGDFQLTFQPSVQGVFTDTLHIWADTDPPHHKIPLIGESGPIPAPVNDLSINILPDLSAQLTWSPVSQTIYGNPVTPDYYLIFYNEQDPADESDWYYLTPVVAPGYTHQLVARFRDLMNYRVVAWKGIDPALLGLTTGVSFATFQQISQDMRR